MLSILGSIYNSGLGGFGMNFLNLSTLTLPLFYFLCFGFPKERLHTKVPCIPYYFFFIGSNTSMSGVLCVTDISKEVYV